MGASRDAPPPAPGEGSPHPMAQGECGNNFSKSNSPRNRARSILRRRAVCWKPGLRSALRGRPGCQMLDAESASSRPHDSPGPPDPKLALLAHGTRYALRSAPPGLGPRVLDDTDSNTGRTGSAPQRSARRPQASSSCSWPAALAHSLALSSSTCSTRMCIPLLPP